MIEITRQAHDAIVKLSTKDPSGRSFRIFIEQKGCDGIHPGFGLDLPIPEDSCLVENDAMILISTRLAQILRGSTLDYVPSNAASDTEEIQLQDFSLIIPHAKELKGKFFKKGDNTEWDLL